MKYIFPIFFSLVSLGCRSQSTDEAEIHNECNRAVYIKEYLKHLPSNICLPKGYQVMMVNNKTDLTGDAIPELVIKLEKQAITDGDTSLLYVYRKNTKGIYEIFKTLHNVYPLYFKSYSLDYTVTDSKLNETQARYSSAEFSEVLFKDNRIIIKFHSEATMGYNFHFVFNKQKQDWFLQKIEEWKGRRGQVEQIESIITPEDNSKISEFNFLDYL